jgi:hypothetical protein
LIVCSSVIIVLFGSFKKFGSRVTRVLIGISAVALGCFGAYQLWSGASNFKMPVH